MKKWRRRKNIKQVKSKHRLNLDFIVTEQENQMTALVAKRFILQERYNDYAFRKKLITDLATKILGRARKVKERLQQIDFEFNNF